MRFSSGCLLLALASGLATAHEFENVPIAIKGFGNTARFRIVDPTGCTALITAESADPTIATVTPPGPISSADLTFTVTARRSGNPSISTFITVRWAGDVPGKCDERATRTIPVTISDFVAETNSNRPYAPRSWTDPVNLVTGEFYFEEPPDLYLSGPMPLALRRFYGSRLQRDGNYPGAMGANWLHSYESALGQFSADGTSAAVTDNHGRLIRFRKSGQTWSLDSPAYAAFQLVESGGSYLMADPTQDRIYVFNTAGLLIQIRDRFGNAHSLTYSGRQLMQVSDGAGRSFSFTYDNLGRIATAGDGQRTVRYAYLSNTQTSFTDARGKTTSYEYDRANSFAGLLTKVARPRGNAVWSQTYDAMGRAATQTDGAGHTTRFDYRAGETAVTDPSGARQVFAYGSTGSLATFNDENGKATRFGYDAAGKPNSVTDSLGNRRAFTIDPVSGKLASITEPDGGVTSYTYATHTVNGLVFRPVSRINYPDSTSQTFSYDNAGNLISMTDRSGKTRTWTYNSNGQVLTMTNPAGGVTTFTYNTDRSAATARDAAGNVTRFSYDALKRLTTVTYADNSTRRYSYDENDHPLSVTDERDKSGAYTYDDNGNLASQTRPAGNKIRLGYDGLDRLISAADDSGAVASRTYDALGRIASVTDRNGNTARYGYDVAGRLTTFTDRAGKTWLSDYDSEGFLISEISPLRATRKYVPDAFGHLAGETSATGGVSRFRYDAMERLSGITDPLAAQTSFGFNASGELTSAATENISTRLTRNDLGLATQITDPRGQVWQRTYDSFGRPISAADPLGNTEKYSYDSRNRLSKIEFPAGMGTVDIGYDTTGNRARAAYSDGTELTFTYDDNGQLTGGNGLSLGYDAQNLIVRSNGLELSRDPGGRIAAVTLAPGKVLQYTYDSRDRVAGVTDWMGGVTALTYDDDNRLATITRPNGVTTAYQYDGENFLTAVRETRDTGEVSSILLTRDLRGQIVEAARNLPGQTGDIPDAAFTVDAASQLASFSYDAMGRLVRDSSRGYSWDLASRLSAYESGAGAANLTYDALGRRISRTEAGVTRQFVWNYALALPSISVVRQGEADLRYYVQTSSGTLLYSIEADSGARQFYHFDEMGNTAFLTGDDGAVSASYAYGPYGEPMGPAAAVDNPFTFGGASGVWRETSDGLYYIRARYYDALSARFLSRDSKMKFVPPTETNPYGYARSNPLGYTDARGRDARLNHQPDDVHTDVSVDVWEGDQIVGVLNMSFGEGGYRRRKQGQGQGSSSGSSSGGVLANGEGTFTFSFIAGKTIADQGALPGNVIHGSKDQDERMAQAMLAAADWTGVTQFNYHAGTSPGIFLRRLWKETRTENNSGRTTLSFGQLIPGRGDWTTYGVLNARTCNTFSSEMLDVYYGETYGSFVFGSTITASGVEEDIQQHETVRKQAQDAANANLQPIVVQTEHGIGMFILRR